MREVVCPECDKREVTYSFIDVFCSGNMERAVHREALMVPPRVLGLTESIARDIGLAQPANEAKKKEEKQVP